MSSYGYTIFQLCRSALQTHLVVIKIQLSGEHNAKHAHIGWTEQKDRRQRWRAIRTRQWLSLHRRHNSKTRSSLNAFFVHAVEQWCSPLTTKSQRVAGGCPCKVLEVSKQPICRCGQINFVLKLFKILFFSRKHNSRYSNSAFPRIRQKYQGTTPGSTQCCPCAS